jgi:hypothetical protein
MQLIMSHPRRPMSELLHEQRLLATQLHPAEVHCFFREAILMMELLVVVPKTARDLRVPLRAAGSRSTAECRRLDA